MGPGFERDIRDQVVNMGWNVGWKGEPCGCPIMKSEIASLSVSSYRSCSLYSIHHAASLIAVFLLFIFREISLKTDLTFSVTVTSYGRD